MCCGKNYEIEDVACSSICIARTIAFLSHSADITFVTFNQLCINFSKLNNIYPFTVQYTWCSTFMVCMLLFYGNGSAAFTCSVLELVDAAVDPSLLEPIRKTILKVDGVKVEWRLLPEIHFFSQFCIFFDLQCHDYRSFWHTARGAIGWGAEKLGPHYISMCISRYLWFNLLL